MRFSFNYNCLFELLNSVRIIVVTQTSSVDGLHKKPDMGPGRGRTHLDIARDFSSGKTEVMLDSVH